MAIFLWAVFGVSVWILKDMSKLKMVINVGGLEKDKRCIIVKGWVNLNLNEIKFACNSKYSKVNFSCMPFYDQIQFILQMLKYYGFSSFSVEDVNTMYQLINIKSIENTDEVGDILTKLDNNDIETRLYEEILLYGYKREYIEDSDIYLGGRLNYSERND